MRTSSADDAEGRYSDANLRAPTLTKAGSFKKLTGLGRSGPRDFAFRHQSLKHATRGPAAGPGPGPVTIRPGPGHNQAPAG